MNRAIFKKFIYIFIGIIGMFLFCPNEVFAKQELVKCNYQNQDSGSLISYTLTIYDDYSAYGNFNSYNADSIGDIQNNKFNNWNSLKDIARTKTGTEMCPKFAIIKKTGTFVLVDYSASGYYNENEFYQQLQKEIEATYGNGSFLDFLAGTLRTFGLPTIITPAWLFRATNESGTEIIENNSPGNPNRSTADGNITGNETNSKCTDFLGDPTDSKSVAWLLQKFFNYMKVLGPILVILFSTLDFTKTIMNSDEEAMKKSQKKLGIRMMCAVGIYFLPMLITLILNLIFGTADANSICGIR